MARNSPWWRKIGTALAALVLTVLTFGPSLDDLVCRNEDGLAAAAAQTEQLTVAAEHHDTGAGIDGLGDVCLHGHCHHATAYVPVSPTASDTPTYVVSVARRPVRGRVPTSDPQFGLLRPPRA